MLYLRASFADKLNTDYSIFVSFKYNPDYVNLMKQMPKRAWNNTTKEWEIGWDCYSDLIGTLNNYNIPYNGSDFMYSIEQLKQMVEKIQVIQKQDANVDASILDNVEFKTKPYQYQREGIAYGLTHNRFLLADDQGLGKTYQTCNIASLKKGGKHCLIIVGYDSLQFNWVREAEQHTNETAHVLGQKINRKGKIVCGTVKDRFNDLQQLDQIEDFFIITTITTLRQCIKEPYIDKKGKKKNNKIFYIADLIEDWCRKGEIGRIIYDEFQTVKNWEVDQTQALMRLKCCPYKIAATGTPIMNKNMDLYPLFQWLGFDNTNFYEFRQRYCKLGGFKGKQIMGNKNNPELHARLSQFMIRRKKEDVLDLPEKIFINELLDIDGKQWSLYEKTKIIAKQRLSQMKGNKVELLAATLSLRKITCHPKWVDDTLKDSVKFERVRQIVYEAFENNRKTIIFSNWATPIQWLYEELKMYNPAMIIGDTKDRIGEVDKFQKDPSCFVILGTIGAMGTGLTLNAASNVIFIDEPWNRALKDQATDRAHRIGTKYNVNIYTLICKDTIDERVHNTVYKKGRIADEIIDGVTTEELEDILNN